ncbi:MAG: hypothetical protein JXR37_05355 [Kiritimatiellae bacterium]|nr:hypothetical protein [Kiritimatiellia bacterium]
MKFQYADGSFDPRAHTYLPIRISSPGTQTHSLEWGLLDTGADSCLFPGSLAARLGHELKGEGVKSSVASGIQQMEVDTYVHTFRLELLAPDLTTVVWTSGVVEVDCVDSDHPPVILGVDEFLSHFRITVDYPAEESTLHWSA